MKRNTISRKVARRAHWYTPSGAGFTTRERALVQVAAEMVAIKQGHPNMGDAAIAARLYEAITRELVRVRKANGG